MATYTDHYNLKKPALNDAVNINDINGNSDIIDTELYKKADKSDIEGLTASDIAYNNTTSELTATDVQGAVDELNDKFGREKLIKEVTADGIKTYKDLFLELYASAEGYTGFSQLRIATAYFTSTSRISFCRISYSSNTFHFETIGLSSTNATYHKGDMTTSGTWTYTNMSATVPELGTKIGLYKCN